MNRETKEITTLSGKKVTINGYLTGPEANEVNSAMFEGIEIEAPEAGERMAKVKIPLSATIKRQPALLKASVIAVDAEVDPAKALEIIALLPADEYTDLIKQIDASHKGLLPETK